MKLTDEEKKLQKELVATALAILVNESSKVRYDSSTGTFIYFGTCPYVEFNYYGKRFRLPINIDFGMAEEIT